MRKLQISDSFNRLHADPRLGTLNGLIWPKRVCIAELFMVFFQNLDS